MTICGAIVSANSAVVTSVVQGAATTSARALMPLRGDGRVANESPCAGYTGHPFKKSEGTVPKLSASPVLATQLGISVLEYAVSRRKKEVDEREKVAGCVCLSRWVSCG